MHSERTPAIRLDAVRSVKLRPRLALGVAAVVFLLVAGYALTRKPMYKAESLTYVEPLASKLVSDGSEGVYDGSRYDSYLQQQMQTAQRPDILMGAIEKLPAGTWQLPGESLQASAERLSNALKIARVGTSYQLSISLQGANPDATAAVVNAATNTYLEQGRKDEHARSDGRLQLLTDESQRIQAELTQDRAEQRELGAQLGVANAASGSANPYDAQLDGLRSELVTARTQHDVAAAQLASVASGADAGGLKAVAEDAIAGDSGLGSFKASVNQRRATLSSAMSGLTPSNPVYKQDQAEIAQLDREVDARATQLRQGAERRVQEKLRLDLQRTGDVESRLNGQLARATAAATGAAPKLQRASELAADVSRLEARYATVDDALRGLQLETNGPGTAHLSVAATVPSTPEASKRGLMLALALPLALLAGIMAAVIARKRDPRVYSAMDVESALGIAPVAVMPVSYEVSEAAEAEALLRMAAGMERAYRMNSARSFVFTAASAEMEISGFVASLRKKLVTLGFRAVVVDANRVWRAESAREQARDGFAAGRLEQLKKENHFVLVDALPLLHSADAEYVASAADATFLVVDSGVTTGDELQQAMVVLRKLRARGVGTVLQNVATKFSGKFGQETFRAPMDVVQDDSRSEDAWDVPVQSVPVTAKVAEEPAREFLRIMEVATPAKETPRVILEEVVVVAAPAEAVVSVPVVEPASAPVVRFAETPLQRPVVDVAERREVRFSDVAVVAEVKKEAADVVSAQPGARVDSTPAVKIEKMPTPRMMAWGASIKTGSKPDVKVETPAVEVAAVEAVPTFVEAVPVEEVARVEVPVSGPVRVQHGSSVTIDSIPTPVLTWAPRVERRRVPRIAEGSHGLKLAGSSARRPVVAAPKPVVVDDAAVPVGRRWHLLSRLDEQFEDARALMDKAAG